MESELLSLLSSHPLPEHPSLARYIEPHLPLIKSRTLSAFYYDLRYQRLTYMSHISSLVHDSIQDYRLRSLLEQIVRFIKTSQRI
jgi:hypothetical protein